MYKIAKIGIFSALTKGQRENLLQWIAKAQAATTAVTPTDSIKN